MNSPMHFPVTPVLEPILLGRIRNEWLLPKAEREYCDVGIKLSLFDPHQGIPSLFYRLISVDDEFIRRGIPLDHTDCPEDTVGEKIFELLQLTEMPTLDGLRSALDAAEHDINLHVAEYLPTTEGLSSDDAIA